jgi:release factor glutamine methyltransferase
VLRAGGAALLELGGDQAGLLEPELDRLGFAAASVLADSDGDVRGIEATLARRGVG